MMLPVQGASKQLLLLVALLACVAARQCQLASSPREPRVQPQPTTEVVDASGVGPPPPPVEESTRGEVEPTGALVSVPLRRAPTGDGLLYAEVQIGPWPNQTYNLLVCNSCNVTWVVSDFQSDHFERYYTLQAGPSRVYTSADYAGNGMLVVRLEVHRDTMVLGSASLEGAEFGLEMGMMNPRALAAYNLSGVLGFNGGPDLWDPTNPVNNLYSRGLIRRRIAGLYIADADDAEDAEDADEARDEPDCKQDEATGGGGGGGLLTFGGVSANHFEGQLHYEPMLLKRRAGYKVGWYLNLTEVRLDWSRVAGEGRDGPPGGPEDFVAHFEWFDARPSELHLDSSSALFVGYKRHLDKLLVQFMGARQFGLAGNYAFADCRLDNKPDFVFRLGDGAGRSYELRLEPRDYLLADYQHPNGRRYCLAGFLADDESDEWTLGTRFLRNYYTVYDYGRRQVGFARARHGRRRRRRQQQQQAGEQ